jgi:hypothetical protein
VAKKIEAKLRGIKPKEIKLKKYTYKNRADHFNKRNQFAFQGLKPIKNRLLH